MTMLHSGRYQFRTFFLLTALLVVTYSSSSAALFNGRSKCEAPCVAGDESIMSQKEHGTSKTPVQDDLRWGCDHGLADRICNFNRHYAERAGYWESTGLLSDLEAQGISSENPMIFYDSNTGNPLFKAPVDRSLEDFLTESRHHGWPSFRTQEVVWKYVRVLADGETVSVNGTHLGHDLPDEIGSRFCIDLVSVAGNPTENDER